jgi:hypothetical protein
MRLRSNTNYIFYIKKFFAIISLYELLGPSGSSAPEATIAHVSDLVSAGFDKMPSW